MNRRDVIMGAACATSACLAAERSQAKADTPILRLYRKSRAIVAQAEAATTPNCSHEEAEWLDQNFYNRSDRLEDEMLALPCECAADFAAKMIVVTANGANMIDWDTDPLWAEARELIG